MASHVGPADGRPNVLFIVTDDENLAGMAVMPKTLQWFKTGAPGAAGGTEFTNAFVTTPICCPSRASIFTGRYAHNSGIQTNTDAVDPAPEGWGRDGSSPGQMSTLQYHLKQASGPGWNGYFTGIFGKYFNIWDVQGNDGAPDPPPYFDRYSLWSIGAHSRFVADEQGTVKSIPQYETDYVSDRVHGFLDEAEGEDARPWFLYLAPTVPHSPFTPATQYTNAPVPEYNPPPSYFEQGPLDKPFGESGTSGDDEVRDIRAAQLRMLMSADDMVDSVMHDLVVHGEADNTIAFFISDNGYIWGEHATQGKAAPYDEASRVPLFVRYPDGSVPTGGTDSRLVANIDLAPSVLDATHLADSDPPHADGTSVFDVRSNPALRRNRLLLEFFGSEANLKNVEQFASIRTPTFEYTEQYVDPDGIGGGGDGDPSDNDPPAATSSYVDSAKTIPSQDDDTAVVRQYFDLTSDPYQLNNLLRDGNPRNDPPTAGLAARLAADKACQESSCPGDADPPVLAVDTGIPVKPSSTSGDSSPTFSLTATEPGSSFECALDGAAFESCEATTTLENLAPASHTLDARAVDPWGNRDQTPASYTWTVVASQPDTRLLADPGQPLKLSDRSTATFAFAGSANTSGLECKLDSAGFAPCSDPDGQDYAGLADGKHTFSVRAVQGATADPTPVTYRWQVDDTDPDTTIVSGPASPVLATSATIRYSTSEQIGALDCSLDDQAYVACATRTDPDSIPPGSPPTYTKTWKGLGDGDHKMLVRATDRAGNADPTPARFDWETGQLPTFGQAPDTSWPDVTSGTAVTAVIPDGMGGWFVGGSFSEVGGNAHANIAHLEFDRTVDSWSPAVNGTVAALALSSDGQTLYIGGSFTAVNGVARNGLAALDVGSTEGGPAAWDPSATDSSGAPAAVNALAISSNSVFAGGSFTRIKGVTRNFVAELLRSGNGSPTAWTPQLDPPGSASPYVSALAVNSSSVYVAGSRTLQAGGQPRPLVELSRATGTATAWDPRPDHNVRALALGSSSIFAGGNFVSVEDGVQRRKAAEIDIGSVAAATGWNPSVRMGGVPDGSGVGFVEDITLFPHTVVLGGSFSSLGADIDRSRLAETNRDDGTPTDWNPALNNPGSVPMVYDTAFKDGTLAVAGQFTFAKSIPRRHLAFFTDPAPATTIDNPKPAAQTSSTDAHFNFHSSEPRSTFECVLDGEMQPGCQSPLDLTNIGNGSHVLSIRAVDSKGTPDPTPAVYQWLVDEQTVPNTPDLSWPQVTGTEVRAVIPDGSGGWYVGGEFTRVGASAHTNIAHIKADKTVDNAWNPAANGTVRAMALSLDRQTLYLGGSFTAVNGQSRAQLAAVETAGSGALTGWKPATNGPVYALEMAQASIFAGGTFTTIDGQASGPLAELQLSGSGSRTAWRPAVTAGTVFTIALGPTWMYAGGKGLTVGPRVRNLLELDRVTGAATSWDPAPNSKVRALELSPSLMTIYVGGQFHIIGGALRTRAAEINLYLAHSATLWNSPPASPGGTVYDLSASASVVTVAGAYAELGGLNRLRLGQMADGSPNAWNPRPDKPVYDIARAGSVLAVAGQFTRVNGQPRSLLAFFESQ